MILVKFKIWECTIKFAWYANGVQAIQLVDAHDGSAIATASVNLEEFGKRGPLGRYTWIKTWSENEGILQALVDAGIVRATGETFEVNQYGSLAVLVEILPETLTQAA